MVILDKSYEGIRGVSVAEWLVRWTSVIEFFARVGLNPTLDRIFILLFSAAEYKTHYFYYVSMKFKDLNIYCLLGKQTDAFQIQRFVDYPTHFITVMNKLRI